uniref:PID domain-containing protein n=1 Tax=Plectus sambesii TaxID=2011161 RepID=A0A914UNZ0_9BILA
MTEPDWNLTDQSSIDSDTQVRREQKEKLEAQLHAARKKTADKSRTEWPRWAASSEWTIDRGDAKRPQSSATAAHPRSSSIKSRRSARSTSGSHSMWQIAPPAPACEPLTGVLSSPPSHGRPSQVKAKNANWQSAREGRRQMPGGLADRSASDPDLNGHSMLAHAGVADDSELQSSSTECGSDSDRTTEGISELMLFQCVLVYIGAVPVSNVEKTRRSIVKKAIHSLRLQHAKARTVLFQIFSDEIVVTNSRGAVTNRFKSRNVAFAAPCAENKQYFGVAHIAGNEDVVCHIFAADPQLHLHTFHYHYAKKFSIRC